MFGNSVFSCRLLSALFSIFTAPVVFLIGKEIKNKRFGLIIMILFSISPFSIYYANEIRAYSLIHLLFTINFYFAIRCLKAPNNSKNYAMLGLFAVLLMYTHYMGILYYGALCFSLYIFIRKKNLSPKGIIILFILSICVYIPWLPYAFDDLINGPHGYTGGCLNLINLLYYGFVFFLSPVPSDINNSYIFNLFLLTFLINMPLVIVLILSLFGFILFFQQKQIDSDLKKLITFTISIIFLIIGISITLGFIIPNSFKASNIIGIYTPIYIIQSFGLDYLFFSNCFNIKNKNKRFYQIFSLISIKKIKLFLIFTLLIINLVIYPIFKENFPQKPDWEGCVKKLKEKYEKSDIIIVLYDGGRAPYPLEYYSSVYNFDLEENFYELTYNENGINEFFNEISKDNKTRIWIISFWQKIRDPNDKTNSMLVDEYNLKKVEEYDYRMDINLALYEIS